MADDVELSSAQTEKLLQFQDLTGIDDIARCRLLLASHNWDLEVAVQDTLSIQEGTPSVFNPPSNNAPSVVTHPFDQRIYSVSRARWPHGLRGWSYFFLSFPFRFIYSTFVNIVTFALRLVRPDSRQYVLNPVGDVMSFIGQYEASYGLSHPVFYQGTYSQALNDAKRELKFLLVYLHCEEHQETQDFCRITLSDANVINFINTSMLFWACSITTAEGYKVSQAMRENCYPFLAVIVLRENQMTVVARLEGAVKPQELLDRMKLVIRDNEGSLIAARADRHERNLNQTIRQQQDEAYLESLRADQEKERRKQEERLRQEQEERELHEREMQEIQRKEEIRRQKIELADQIPTEPLPNDPLSIRIVIKLPQGTRLERRFSRNLSLKYLYYFVFCHDESPDEFEIVTNFPRHVLPCKPTPECPEPPSFAESGLGKSEMLFVHDLDA